MANAMPQAIGAKVGSPDRQVIAMCGDGGFAEVSGQAKSNIRDIRQSL